MSPSQAAIAAGGAHSTLSALAPQPKTARGSAQGRMSGEEGTSSQGIPLRQAANLTMPAMSASPQQISSLTLSGQFSRSSAASREGVVPEA